MLVRNQITETHRVLDLAKMIGDMTDTEIAYLPNPRREAEENDLASATTSSWRWA